jgi:hypothetical protein
LDLLRWPSDSFATTPFNALAWQQPMFPALNPVFFQESFFQRSHWRLYFLLSFDHRMMLCHWTCTYRNNWL